MGHYWTTVTNKIHVWFINPFYLLTPTKTREHFLFWYWYWKLIFLKKLWNVFLTWRKLVKPFHTKSLVNIINIIKCNYDSQFQKWFFSEFSSNAVCYRIRFISDVRSTVCRLVSAWYWYWVSNQCPLTKQLYLNHLTIIYGCPLQNYWHPSWKWTINILKQEHKESFMYSTSNTKGGAFFPTKHWFQNDPLHLIFVKPTLERITALTVFL